MSSKIDSGESDDETENNLDNEDFEALFVKNFKKLLNKNKSGMKRNFLKNKAQNRNNYLPKIDKPTGKSFSKNSSKGIKCFECQGYGHIVAKCANRVERRLDRALNVTWDDDSEEQKSQSESISECGGKFIASRSRSSKIFSVQGSSDRFPCQIYIPLPN